MRNTVSPSLADGIRSSATGLPLNSVDIANASALEVYFDGIASPNIPFAGVVPGYPVGMYQINAQVPSGVSNGDDYIAILTPDAEAEQVTLTIAGSNSAATRNTQMTGQRALRSGRGMTRVAPIAR